MSSISNNKAVQAFLSGCNKSQFESRAVINCLFATSLRNSSKALNISILELGGIYYNKINFNAHLFK